jgi:hypothetical protein
MTLRPAMEMVKKRFRRALVGMEVGVSSGENAFTILSEIPKIKKLYLVDPYIANEKYWDDREYEMASQEQISHNRLKEFNGKIEWVKKPFEGDEATELDFIYIDGNHRYDFVRRDILNAVRSVKKGGIVSGHDYNNDTFSVQVKKAVDEFCEKYKIELFTASQYFEYTKKDVYDWWFFNPFSHEKAMKLTLEPLKEIHSWDVFDTVIGRKCGLAEDLFGIMGSKLGIVDFTNKRFIAERLLIDKNVNYTLNDIYLQYTLNEGAEDKEKAERLAQIEFDLEMENVFLIKRVYDKIVDGDILVSDMYLSIDQITKLLLKAGFSKTVELYVSCAGKRIGSIWGELTSKYNIILHTGDHEQNDVQIPKSFGINTELAQTGFTQNEIELVKVNRKFGMFIRYHRLISVSMLEQMQAEYNFSLLMAFTQQLNEWVKFNKTKKLLFMARDGFLLQKLWMKMHPEIESEYVYVSRDCLSGTSDDFFEYFNSKLTDGAALVDMYGSCESLRKALPRLKRQNIQVYMILYNRTVDLGSINCNVVTTQASEGITGHNMEMLNFADHWHVDDVTRNGIPKFNLENEYDMNLVWEAHKRFYRMLEDFPPITFSEPAKMIVALIHGIAEHKDYLNTTFRNYYAIEYRRTRINTAKVMAVSAVYNDDVCLPTLFKKLDGLALKPSFHIFVTNNCTDQTDPLIDEYLKTHPGKRISYNMHPDFVVKMNDPYAPAAIAWQRGLREARKMFESDPSWSHVLYLDSDVFIETPDAIRRAIARDKSIVAGPYLRDFPNGRHLAGVFKIDEDLVRLLPQYKEKMGEYMYFDEVFFDLIKVPFTSNGFCLYARDVIMNKNINFWPIFRSGPDCQIHNECSPEFGYQNAAYFRGYYTWLDGSISLGHYLGYRHRPHRGDGKSYVKFQYLK